MSGLPLPPFDLRQRVGAATSETASVERRLRKAPWWDPDPQAAWLGQGRYLAGLLREHLPTGFELRGARVLDFGCGAGRVLRHLVDDVGDDGELHGVDIDRPSIDWLRVHASPPIHAEYVDNEPGLPYADGSFDLVFAYSVFTHLAEHWAGWLLELHRVLAPDGVLFSSLIGRRTGDELGLTMPAGEAPGMYVTALGNPWELGGPVTVHDQAWIAERWGRAFEIVSHTPRATGQPWPHDILVARRRSTRLTVDDLLAPGDDGVREGLAQRGQLEMLRADSLARRVDFEGRASQIAAEAVQLRAGVEGRVDRRVAELTARRGS